MTGQGRPTVGRTSGRLSWRPGEHPPLPASSGAVRRKRLRPVSTARYRSSVCSTADAALAEIVRAIDELAAASREAAAPELAARIARIWAMVADVDPELARRRLGYEHAADGLTPGGQGGPPEQPGGEASPAPRAPAAPRQQDHTGQHRLRPGHPGHPGQRGTGGERPERGPGLSRPPPGSRPGPRRRLAPRSRPSVPRNPRSRPPPGSRLHLPGAGQHTGAGRGRAGQQAPGGDAGTPGAVRRRRSPRPLAR